ncbi:pentapeptide repeat-containing protein [Chryseobacterium populi]|uniref:Putative low-complexity protein n=1 Tax=Chryseobacterium populi TaxID=1144316 RepID=J2T0D6_9FLAO|nr:pentapeptide repeat-containing protein [Chryseobacterium populi]EJL71422.1 putative low-complexity protein [Chryseobacterium populi]
MDTKILGGKIVNARKVNNMSQAQLAGLLFISPQAVGKWERGESIPDFITINRLSEIFNVDLNYFSENLQSLADEQLLETINNQTGETRRGASEETEFSVSQNHELLTNFSGSALAETDLAGVKAPKRKFFGSDLQRANFAGADLTGSSFKGSNMQKTDFKETNLTDCSLSANNLTDTIFNKTILVRTEFHASELTNAEFTDVKLIDVKFTATDLKETIFKNCEFKGVHFKSADMSGMCLDGQVFIDVKFDNAALNEASFKGATFRNVSFRPTFALTNRYYKTLKTICFEGAMMDKLTYAALKGLGVDLSKAMTI